MHAEVGTKRVPVGSPYAEREPVQFERPFSKDAKFKPADTYSCLLKMPVVIRLPAHQCDT